MPACRRFSRGVTRSVTSGPPSTGLAATRPVNSAVRSSSISVPLCHGAASRRRGLARQARARRGKSRSAAVNNIGANRRACLSGAACLSRCVLTALRVVFQPRRACRCCPRCRSLRHGIRRRRAALARGRPASRALTVRGCGPFIPQREGPCICGCACQLRADSALPAAGAAAGALSCDSRAGLFATITAIRANAASSSA